MKKMFLFLLIALSCCGCSKEYWLANFYMFQAENAFMEAYKLKVKKSDYDQRLPYYRKACSYFLKVYHLRSHIFTLNRIQEAADSCWRVNDIEAREKFLEFEEKYAKDHPQEYEYGDAGAFWDVGGQ